MKDDIVKGSGSTVLGAALFVFNGGTTPEAAAEEHQLVWEVGTEWGMTYCSAHLKHKSEQTMKQHVISCFIMFEFL